MKTPEQPASLVTVQVWSGMQHAPDAGQGFGVQTSSAIQVPTQSACGEMAQEPPASQQAPLGSAQGFGVHTPPNVQLPPQAVGGVKVQVPSEAQQEPSVTGVVGSSSSPHAKKISAAQRAIIASLCMAKPPSSPAVGSPGFSRGPGPLSNRPTPSQLAAGPLQPVPVGGYCSRPVKSQFTAAVPASSRRSSWNHQG